MGRHTRTDTDAPVAKTGAFLRSRTLVALGVGLLAGLLVGGTAAVALSAGDTIGCQPGQVIVLDANGTWACQDRPAPSESPTPSPSATQTASPSPSTTPSPSPTVSPTATTPPATTPPATTPPPSPSPTPSPTIGPVSNCMPDPSSCGWPDADNTGTTGPLTIVNGNVTLTTPGMVYEGKDVRGCISVRAKNITIRNVRVTCSTWYAIGVNTGTSGNIWNAPDANLLVEDTEISMGGAWDVKGIAFDGYTARRVHFYGGADCAHFGRNVTIVDSFCEIPTGGPADGPHYDGFQSDGGSNIVLRHNTIRVPYSQTSAILMSTNTSPIRDVSIVDNLVAGGGYSIYCGTGAGGPVLGTFTFSGNRVAKTYFPKGGYWGPTTSCPATGWVWDA